MYTPELIQVNCDEARTWCGRAGGILASCDPGGPGGTVWFTCELDDPPPGSPLPPGPWLPPQPEDKKSEGYGLGVVVAAGVGGALVGGLVAALLR